MAKTITITIPDVHIARIKQKFREVLGRDLTPEESRYLGVFDCISITEGDEISLQNERRRLRVLKKLRDRKTA